MDLSEFLSKRHIRLEKSNSARRRHTGVLFICSLLHLLSQTIARKPASACGSLECYSAMGLVLR